MASTFSCDIARAVSRAQGEGGEYVVRVPVTAGWLAARALGNSKGGEKMADKGILSHDEVLELLSERAREGSISAAIALERALRATPKSDQDWDDELSRIIADD